MIKSLVAEDLKQYGLRGLLGVYNLVGLTICWFLASSQTTQSAGGLYSGGTAWEPTNWGQR